jgi:hypothetical protein
MMFSESDRKRADYEKLGRILNRAVESVHKSSDSDSSIFKISDSEFLIFKTPTPTPS